MYIKVYVTADARRERVEVKEEMLIVAVREPARGNRANMRVREIVAAHFSVPLWQVAILTGHHSRGKMLVVNS